jgi:hypothetical protein
MRSKLLILSAALVLPLASGTAQRRSAGGTGEPAPRAARPQRPPTMGQLEDLNPASVLVDKRKRITLADSQVTQLKAIEKKIRDRNAPILAEYDSVRKEMRFPTSLPQGGEMGASMGTGARNNRNRASGSSSSTGGGGSSPDQTPEAQAKLRSQMQVLGQIGVKLQERRAADVAEALAVLTPDQLEKAREFITEQDEEFDRILPRAPRGA